MSFSPSDFKFFFYVAKNGNDTTGNGSVARPYLTVQAGINAAKLVATVTTRACVMVMPGTYTETYVLPANVLIKGQGYNQSRLIGNWTLDANFTPAGDHRSGWSDVGLFGGTITANFLALTSNEGKLYSWNTRFGGAIVATSFSTINQWLNFGGEVFGPLTLNGMNTQFNNVVTQNSGAITCNYQAGGQNAFAQSGGFRSATTINGVGGTFTAYLHGDIEDGASLALNGASATVIASVNALPIKSLITFAGGATDAQITRNNDANGLGYTPSTPTDWLTVPTKTQTALDALQAYNVLTSVPILDNQAAPVTLFSYPAASQQFGYLAYSVERGGALTIAEQTLLTDGATLIGASSPESIGVTGVTISKTISAGIVYIQYTSTATGAGGTFKYSWIKKWN